MQRLLFGFAFALAAALALYMFVPRGYTWERYDRGLGINATYPDVPAREKLGPCESLVLWRGPGATSEGRGRPYERNQFFSVGRATFAGEKAAVQYEDSRLVGDGEQARLTTLGQGWSQIESQGALTRVLRRGNTVYVVEVGGSLKPLEAKTFLDSVEVVP